MKPNPLELEMLTSILESEGTLVAVCLKKISLWFTIHNLVSITIV